MNEFIKKLIERLEEINYNDIQMVVSGVLEKYGFPKESVVQDEIWDELDGLCTSKPAIEIVNQLAAEYAECYQYCGECEAYDKENHHCPKFCKVITDALAEMEENRAGWILCSERLPEMSEYDVKTMWVTMHRKGIDFYFTKRVCWNNYHKRWEWKNGKEMADTWEVIAWQYMNVPAPYQPMICQDAECPYNDNNECSAAEGCAGYTEGE